MDVRRYTHEVDVFFCDAHEWDSLEFIHLVAELVGHRGRFVDPLYHPPVRRPR
jgi:hypothetical protein